MHGDNLNFVLKQFTLSILSLTNQTFINLILTSNIITFLNQIDHIKSSSRYFNLLHKLLKIASNIDGKDVKELIFWCTKQNLLILLEDTYSLEINPRTLKPLRAKVRSYENYKD